MPKTSTRQIRTRFLAQVALVLPFPFLVSGCGSADDRYTALDPSLASSLEPFEGSVTSADPPFVERSDGGYSRAPHRIVFHISQRTIVEQFQMGDRVRAKAYGINLPCDCGPDEIPPRGLALIDIELEDG